MVGTKPADVFTMVTAGPAIMFAFGGAVVGDAVAAASAEVCVLFRESGDQRECRDEFSIRSGELFGEGCVCSC
jgi:hypothetical protein